MKKGIILLIAVVMLNGCGILDQVGGAYNLSQCEFTYNSLEKIQLAGIDIGNGSTLSVAKMASISTILSGLGNMQTIPLNMTLKMDIKNPNTTAAFLNALDYAVEINDLEFTTGKMDIPIRIEPGQTNVLPINIGVDIKNLMNRYSQDRVQGVMNSFLGISSDKTEVTVKLWPKVMVGNTAVKSPAAIPVVFTFGGN